MTIAVKCFNLYSFSLEKKLSHFWGRIWEKDLGIAMSDDYLFIIIKANNTITGSKHYTQLFLTCLCSRSMTSI